MHCKSHTPANTRVRYLLTVCTVLTLAGGAHADCLSDAKTTGDAVNCLKADITELQGLQAKVSELQGLQAKISELQQNLKAVQANTRLPQGLVAAFRSFDCPEGWAEYAEASGRVIIGTGNVSGRGKILLEQTGGNANITLSLNQMPKHQHNTAQAMDNNGPNFGLGPRRRSVHGSQWLDNTTELTSPAGEGAAIDITPPFVALKYCIKK